MGQASPAQPNAVGFEVIKRRWVVERTFSWFGRNGCLAKDYENLAATVPSFVTLATIHFGIRWLSPKQAFKAGLYKAALSRTRNRL